MRTSTIKTIGAVVLTGVGSALVVGFQAPDTPAAAVTTASTTASGIGSTSTSTGTTSGTTSTSSGTVDATAGPSSTPTAVAAAATYADGTWTGEPVDEPWGTFQVQAVVSGGRVTDVVVVAAPQDRHSSRINDEAIPILTEAAIASQSADLDLLSGATWTSESYITSLQAALDQAAAAAAVDAAA